MGSQELQQLRSILNQALDELENITGQCSPTGTWPSLDQPINPSPDTVEWTEPHKNPEVKKLSNVIVAAAYQLINVVREPFQSLADVACTSFLTAAIRTAGELNVAEVLREHGNGGAHIDDIAKSCRAHPEKLGRCLRILASHHIFREPEPNVFANNRISSLLDSGISNQTLLEDQLNKYTSGTSSADTPAYVGHFSDEVTKASIYHLEDVKDEKQIDEHYKTPFQKAFNTDQNLFSWLHDPANRYIFMRHNACVGATMKWDAPETTLEGFDWSSLAPGSLIVDVGGGTGRPALALARAFPHLKIVIQEIKPVVDKGLEFWKRNYNEALLQDRVSFAVHNFFDPQPLSGAQVYFARVVCHNWNDAQVIKMLKNLREAASPYSRLVIADNIIPFASRGSIPHSQLIKNQEAREVPSPLLGNLGKASVIAYYMDIAMQLLLNGKERTLPQFVHVLDQAKWRVLEVRLTANSNFGFIISEPV